MAFGCWFPSCSIFVGLWKKHAAKLLFAIGFVPTLFHFSSAQEPVNDSVSMKRASAHASTNTFYTSWLASAIANNLQTRTGVTLSACRSQIILFFFAVLHPVVEQMISNSST
jgi:hypothetical protein